MKPSHIVISGTGEIAYRIAEAAMMLHRVTLIQEEATSAARLQMLDVEAIVGSSTSSEILRSARVDHADLYVATSPQDEKNIVSCVAARQLGAKHVVCFLTRRGFLSMDRNEEQSFADSIGIDSIVRPAGLLAEEILRIVTVEGALDVRSFAEGRLQLMRFEVLEDSPLRGRPLRAVSLPKDTLIVMGRRGEDYFIPHGETIIKKGDKLTTFGTSVGMQALHHWMFEKRRKANKKSRIFIIGGGVVGSAVAKGLYDAGWNVTIIEAGAERCQQLAEQLDCLVLHGDGSDLALLEQEMTGDVGALIAVTNNDEKNLLISLLGKHIGVQRIITRAQRLINEEIFEKVGVDVVLSAHGAALRWVTDLTEGNTHLVAELEHGNFSLLELVIPPDFPVMPVRSLRFPEYMRIGAILRGNQAVVPTGQDVLKPDDHMLVFCTHEKERDAERFIEEMAQTIDMTHSGITIITEG